MRVPMRVVPLVLALAIVGGTGGARGDGTLNVVAGSGTFGASSCLTVAIGAETGSGRRRALGAFWPAATRTLPGGMCDEADPHVDLEITCSEIVSADLPLDPYTPTVLFAAAKGTDGKTYLLRVEDGHGFGTTQVGVAEGASGAERCGATFVETVAITSGAFVVAAAG